MSNEIQICLPVSSIFPDHIFILSWRGSQITEFAFGKICINVAIFSIYHNLLKKLISIYIRQLILDVVFVFSGGCSTFDDGVADLSLLPQSLPCESNQDISVALKRAKLSVGVVSHKNQTSRKWLTCLAKGPCQFDHIFIFLNMDENDGKNITKLDFHFFWWCFVDLQTWIIYGLAGWILGHMELDKQCFISVYGKYDTTELCC